MSRALRANFDFRIFAHRHSHRREDSFLSLNFVRQGYAHLCKQLWFLRDFATIWVLLRDWKLTSEASLCGLCMMPHSQEVSYGPLVRYVKLRVVHAPGMPGTFVQPPRVSDPDMHHGTCATHVPWCILGSLTSGFLWSRWRGKRSRHSRRMHFLQFFISGKRPILSQHTEDQRPFLDWGWGWLSQHSTEKRTCQISKSCQRWDCGMHVHRGSENKTMVTDGASNAIGKISTKEATFWQTLDKFIELMKEATFDRHCTNLSN